MPDFDALFDEALDLPAGERAAFLDRACVTDDGLPDQELRDRLERLLASADEPDDFFDKPENLLGGTMLGALAATAVRPPPAVSATGVRVGPYEVEGLLGEGGMGAVYRARRADGAFEKAVALKTIRPGLGLTSPATQARFERERQVLAGLDHPGVARLLGGGQTDPDGPFAGVPYLAMEFVDGIPITDYADRERLGVEARVGLIRQACAAVQHAHGRLVVHRDLKPSNVLVAEDDEGAPQVKVLDFGIAKLLGEGEGEPGDPMLTQTGVRLLTPAYAAPEQFRAGAAATSADVYALGVLLYELLTGRWPYASGTTGQRSATEIERLVLEGAPVRASTAVLREEDQATRAFARGETPARIARRLRGDLDLICAKALHPDPARRYTSAAALADDLGRFLDGLPVEARPDSATYRFGRFVRRHRAGSAAAALGLAALLAALGTALWQADRAEDALAAEQNARAAAEAETARAGAMVRFTTGMISSMDPSLVGDSLISVRTMLRAGRSSAEDLADEPALYSSALYTLGSLYGTLGDYDRSLSLLDEAEEALASGESPVTLGLIAARRSATLSRMGRYDEAQVYAERAMSLVEQNAPLDPFEAYHAAFPLAQSYEQAGRYVEAEALWRRIVSGVQQIEDKEFRHLRTLVGAQHGLASSLDEQGKDREAVGHYEAVIDLVNRTESLPPVAAAGSLGNLSSLLIKAEQYEDALPLLQKAFQGARATYGPEHIQAMALKINLARGLALVGEHEEADRLSQEAIDGVVERFGPRSLYAAFMMGKRGSILEEAGRLDEAEATLRLAQEILGEHVGSDHPYVPAGQGRLGRVLLRQGRASEAEPLLRAAYESNLAIGGEASTNTAVDAGALAAALAAMGETRGAAALYRQALASLEEQYPGSPIVERLRAERASLPELGAADRSER